MTTEIEAGIYTLRATGKSDTGEIEVIYSHNNYLRGYDDLIIKRNSFMKDLKEVRGFIDVYNFSYYLDKANVMYPY